MAQFTANRLSSGNRLFPDEVTVDQNGITLKVPGLFSGKAKTFTYHDVYSVSTNNPLVGFSSITFQTRNYDKIVANGFTKDDAEEIKRLAHIGINSTRNGGTMIPTQSFDNTASQAEQARIELEKQKHEHEAFMERQQLEQQETNSRRERADKLRYQGRPTQAFIVEHGSTIGIIAFLIVIAAFILPMVLNSNSDKKLDAELTRKEDRIQSLITEGKKQEALQLIDELQHDSHTNSQHSNGIMSYYSYIDYWKQEREKLRAQIQNTHAGKRKQKSIQPDPNDEIVPTATDPSNFENPVPPSPNSYEGLYPQASSTRLQSIDLTGFTKQELKLMRNEIMARHGYIFKSPELDNYFRKQNWYTPLTNDVSNVLTEVEKQNIALIKQAEK